MALPVRAFGGSVNLLTVHIANINVTTIRIFFSSHPLSSRTPRFTNRRPGTAPSVVPCSANLFRRSLLSPSIQRLACRRAHRLADDTPLRYPEERGVCGGSRSSPRDCLSVTGEDGKKLGGCAPNAMRARARRRNLRASASYFGRLVATGAEHHRRLRPSASSVSTMCSRSVTIPASIAAWKACRGHLDNGPLSKSSRHGLVQDLRDRLGKEVLQRPRRHLEIKRRNSTTAG